MNSSESERQPISPQELEGTQVELPDIPSERWFNVGITRHVEKGCPEDEVSAIRQWIEFASQPLTLRIVWIVLLGLSTNTLDSQGNENPSPEDREKDIESNAGMMAKLSQLYRGELSYESLIELPDAERALWDNLFHHVLAGAREELLGLNLNDVPSSEAFADRLKKLMSQYRLGECNPIPPWER